MPFPGMVEKANSIFDLVNYFRLIFFESELMTISAFLAFLSLIHRASLPHLGMPTTLCPQYPLPL